LLFAAVSLTELADPWSFVVKVGRPKEVWIMFESFFHPKISKNTMFLGILGVFNGIYGYLIYLCMVDAVSARAFSAA
jgi:hypothetical protein